MAPARLAVGGVFLASHDIPRLVAWYRDLGVPLSDEGMAIVPEGASPVEGVVFSIHPAAVDLPPQPRALQEEPYGRRRVTLNLRVPDLDAVLAGLRARNVAVAGPKDYGYGRFAWVEDPDGNVVEVWQVGTPP